MENREKVDILELLHKAKIDLKPLLSSLTANKARLKESSEYLFIVWPMVTFSTVNTVAVF